MNINDWFNIDDPKHLAAYVHLGNTGWWPEGFIPSDIEFSPTWTFGLSSKMANRYCELMLGK